MEVDVEGESTKIPTKDRLLVEWTTTNRSLRQSLLNHGFLLMPLAAKLKIFSNVGVN